MTEEASEQGKSDCRHPGESRDPVAPVHWTPAFAGVTAWGLRSGPAAPQPRLLLTFIHTARGIPAHVGSTD